MKLLIEQIINNEFRENPKATIVLSWGEFPNPRTDLILIFCPKIQSGDVPLLGASVEAPVTAFFQLE